jgi:hypothetical protein
MIKGAAYWQDRNRYYTQSNNAIERILSRYGARVSAVTCGPSSAINCIASMGCEVETPTPGGWLPQPEDVLTIWFHDHRNWSTLAEIRKATDPRFSKYSPHEVPQYYPEAVSAVFGVTADFAWEMLFPDVVGYVSNGWAVMMNHKPERNRPGHYVALVAHDSETGELIYHDSWPEGAAKNIGWGLRISHQNFSEFERYGVIFKGVTQ